MATLKQFGYLLSIAETRHFRQAAERHDITQPTLSAQLAALEQSLGVRLVERSRSGVSLTPIGREIAERAELVLRDVQNIMDLAAGAQHGLHGTIRLGVPPTLGPYLLPAIVNTLHSTYPELKLYVREGRPKDLQAELAHGVFDLVLMPLPILSPTLNVARLFREPLYIVVSKDHPFASKKQIERKDLKGQSVLALESGHHLHDQVRQLCEDFGAILLRDYEGTSLDTIRQMVGMGMGISFLPALYVQSEISKRSEVVAIKLDHKSLYRMIGLVWREHSTIDKTLKELAALIRDTASRKFPDLAIVE